VDVKPGPVGPETEPEDEGDEAHNEKEAQEGGADHLGDPRCEAFVDSMDVVANRVVPVQFHGFRVRTTDVVNRYVVVVVHFGLHNVGDG